MRRTELVIFIRPKIIRNGNDAHRADELQDKLINMFGPPIAAAPSASAAALTARRKGDRQASGRRVSVARQQTHNGAGRAAEG